MTKGSLIALNTLIASSLSTDTGRTRLPAAQWPCIEKYFFHVTNGGNLNHFLWQRHAVDFLRSEEVTSATVHMGRSITSSEVTASPALCETSWRVAGPEDSTARGAHDVLPPQEKVDLWTATSEAREELPGPKVCRKYHLRKTCLRRVKGEICRH